jgi:hypothetical protein
MQLNRYAKSFAKMELMSFDFETFSADLEENHIDFIAKRSDGLLMELQVLYTREIKYMLFRREDWISDIARAYVLLIVFLEGKNPEAFLFPAISWKFPNELIKMKRCLENRNEYGIFLSKQNMRLLECYRLETMLKQLL